MIESEHIYLYLDKKVPLEHTISHERGSVYSPNIEKKGEHVLKPMFC